MSEEKIILITPEEVVATTLSKNILLKSKGIKCAGLFFPKPIGTICETKCHKTGNIKIKQRID